MTSPLSRAARFGYSLVELVIALGLLAGMLISVAGILSLGNRQVAGGGRATRALAVARSTLESLEVYAYHRTYERLGCDGARDVCRVATGQSIPGSWDQFARVNLPHARVELCIEAVGASSLDAASALRLTVRVRWREGLRFRTLRLTTVRV